MAKKSELNIVAVAVAAPCSSPSSRAPSPSTTAAVAATTTAASSSAGCDGLFEEEPMLLPTASARVTEHRPYERNNKNA